MNAGGWRGVHAIDAIAHGEGPRTFADLVTQEFQWSRSLTTILLQYSPRYLPKLSPRLKFQFVFSQLWYPLFSIFMAIMFAMPVIALVGGVNFVNVSFPLFLLHVSPLSLIMIVIAYRLRASGSNRPSDAKVVSWEGLLFLLARWPWSLAGTIAALRDWATGSFVDFRVTPKGRDPAGPLSARVLAPYAAISLASALPALLIDNAGAARGFYAFAIYNAALYAILLLAVVAAHLREGGISLTARSGAALRPLLLATLLFVPAAAATTARATDGLEALAWGAGRMSFTHVVYGAAGAGQGKVGVRRVKFELNWLEDEQAMSVE
jgi:cellulose synthase (UDP-forming)